MGSSFYSYSDRSVRAVDSGYYTKDANDIFEQNRKRRIHESMEPSKALLRESRDSQNHPLSVPIILALDVTGSMGRIPHYMVKDGLPNMMSNIIERGVSDPQVLFLAIGDHECDKHPLQVGQFESGDVELDMWLTRTYVESGGGSNEGESYLLTWYFASNHTITDNWEKRGQRGFIFTIGDEPSLRSISSRRIESIMGVKSEKNEFTDSDLLKLAQQTYNVYHLHVMEGSAGYRSYGYWKQLLGDNCIKVDHHEDVSKIISEIVTENVKFTETPKILIDNKKSDEKEPWGLDTNIIL